MKRITAEDLQRVAFTKGATLINGPIVAPKPAPPANDPLIRKAIESNADATQQMSDLVAALVVDLRHQRDDARPIVSWTFDVIYNEDTDRLQTIVATASRKAAT